MGSLACTSRAEPSSRWWRLKVSTEGLTPSPGAATRACFNGGPWSESPITVERLPFGQPIRVDFAGGTVGRVKLVPGVIATPWARRLFADELQLCQRYYEKSYRPFTAPGAVEDNAGNPNAILLQGLGFLFGVPFKATKRVPPAVTIYRPSTGSAGWIERANEVDPLLVIHLESSENGIGLIILNRGPDRNDLYQYQWSADAEL